MSDNNTAAAGGSKEKPTPKKFSPLNIAAVTLCLVALFVIFNNLSGKKRIISFPDRSISTVSVNSFTPEGDVTGTSNISIEFSQNMTDDSNVDRELTEPPVKIKPSLPARYKWISPHILRIFPTEQFRPATEYVVTVLPEVVTSPRMKLEGERSFSFRTEPLKVTFSRTDFLYERGPSVVTRAQWKVEFNQEVSPKDFFSNIEMRYEKNGPGEKVNFSKMTSGAPAREFTVVSEPLARDENKTSLKMTARKGLRGIHGPLGLEHDFIAMMKIETSLKVYNVEARQQQMANAIMIEFSAPVDPSLAREHIKLSPKIDWQIEADGRALLLKGNFKPDATYILSIKKGLLGADSTTLAETFSQSVMFGDMEPGLSFRSKGIFLFRGGKRKVAVDSVNVNQVRVEVTKVFSNNLIHLLGAYSGYADEDEWNLPRTLGRIVRDETLDVVGGRNKMISTVISLGELEDQGQKGIFRVVVRSNEDYWRNDSLLALLTDMGIIARKTDDSLIVWVNSIEKTAPVEGAQISLYSDNNQVISECATQADGSCRFDNLPALLEAENYTPFVIIARKGDDISFLKFDNTEMPVATFDVGGGETVVSGYEAFLYPERDIFRPGERARLAAIVRGKSLSIPDSFPVKLTVTDPRQQTFSESISEIGKEGMAEFDISFPDYAMTGRYKVSLEAAKTVIGRTTLSVEDFIPDKIKTIIKTDEKVYSSGDSINIYVEGQTLFGPPAANRDVEAKLLLKKVAFSPLKWRDFSFGNSSKKFDEMEIQGGSGKLDENGKWNAKIRIPANLDPGSPLKGVLSATVKEHGGRAVSAYSDVDIHPYPYYIGLRPRADGYAEVGKKFDIECLAVSPEGELEDVGSVDVKIYRNVYHSILRLDESGYYRYVSEYSKELEQSFDFKPGKGKYISFTPEDYGEYLVTVSDPKGKTATEIEFYASGWGYAPWAMDNPDKIEMAVEKASYKVGEKARIIVKAPFAGKALIVTEREKIYEYRTIEMTENTATIEVPVRDEFRPNVFVSITVIKPLAKYDGRSPMRAFGIVPLMVNNNDRKLAIDIKAPKTIRPNSKFDINLSVSKCPGPALLTVSAVDEGILQLTDFVTPDPMAFFYGKKRLATAYYDIYSFILPEVDDSDAAPGGDYMEKVRKRHLTPVGIRRVEPVSLWSGIIKTDGGGRAKASFKVPQFQGRLRVMAVGASKNCFGSSRADIFVRDKITITSTFPRFLSGGDRFSAPVTIFNNTGRDAEITLKLKISGPVSARGGLTRKALIKNNEEKNFSFNLVTANSIGKVSFTLEASGGGASTKDKTSLPIRPSAPSIMEAKSYTVREKKALVINVPEKFYQETQGSRIVISSMPTLKFAGGLQYLLQYPHGCVEQTTSKLFPLLYFGDLAKTVAPDLYKTNSAGYYLKEGIKKLASMQMPNGDFAYWPGGSYTYEWGSIYASHFLVEARIAGYAVPDEVYNKMISRLSEIVGRKQDESSYTLARQSYAAYVLALAGKPSRDAAMRLKESSLEKLGPAAGAQLALSFANMGDMKTAKSLIPTEIHPATVQRQSGGNFSSSVRENAIVLAALVDIFPNNPGIPVLMRKLSADMKNGRWDTTQENAFALMAIGKTLRKNSGKKFTGEATVDGRKLVEFNQDGATIERNDLSGAKIRIKIKGAGTAYVYTEFWGVPIDGDIKERDQGIRVTREYFDINGKPINGNNFEHGEMAIGKLTMTSLQSDVDNVAVVDMLPAGLEIENTRLASRAEIPWISKQEFKPDYMDIRDDRLIIYTNLRYRKTYEFFYALRAVTSGTFVLPPVSAEAMYDPSFMSVNSSGKARVKKKEDAEKKKKQDK